MKRSDLEEGEVYTGTVDRISNSGNGVIEFEEEHVILGNISESAVGEDVDFEYIGDNIAKCLTEKYLPMEYKHPGVKAEKLKHSFNITNRSLSDSENKNELLKGNQ